MKKILATVTMLLGFTAIFAQDRKPEVKENVPLDSIRLSDPAILADKSTFNYLYDRNWRIAMEK